MKHNSPWLANLKKKRKIVALTGKWETDILIIGAGISGMVTAYYQLKDTSQKVTIVDAGKMGHGATGHNAGQIASYFEHPFAQIAKEHGHKLAVDAQRSILGAWDLLDHIASEAQLKHRPLSFAGFAGCTSIRQVISHLENSRLRSKGFIKMDHAYIADIPGNVSKIPARYKELYTIVSHSNVLRKLETKDQSYIAALTVRKGVMNSAKFCEELLEYMQVTYGERFAMFELSPIEKLTAGLKDVKADGNGFSVKAKKAVLCTNGYTNIKVENTLGKGRTVHEGMMKGLVGFMAGTRKKVGRPPTAISYFPKTKKRKELLYFYLTRRPLSSKQVLFCIGGPDEKINEEYDSKKQYVKHGLSSIQKFLGKTHIYTPKTTKFEYQWEGLMGYTKKKVRCIGADPNNPRLLYNLGCNGVGILPSIYGAKKLALLMRGIKFKKSIFDPENFAK